MARFIMLRSTLLFVVIATKTADSQLLDPANVKIGDQICFEGFVMDFYCIERGTLLDAPDIVSLVNPELHSLHCLIDVPVCRESPYELLAPPADGETMYTRAFRLSEDSKQGIIAMASAVGNAFPPEETGISPCTECVGTEGSLNSGFRAEVYGVVVAPAMDDGTPALVHVVDANASHELPNPCSKSFPTEQNLQYGEAIRASSESPCVGTLPLVFGVTFQESQCTCVVQNDLESANIVTEDIGLLENNPNFFGDLISAINDLLIGLNYEYNEACRSCQCIGSACGTIETKERILVRGNDGTLIYRSNESSASHIILLLYLALDSNLTLGEVFGLIPALEAATEPDTTPTSDVSALAIIFGLHTYTDNALSFCMDYNDDSDYKGQACLIVASRQEGQLATEVGELQECTLFYDGQPCTVCKFEVRDNGKNCASADCTGVIGIDGEVDTCTGTGLDGPLQFLDNNLNSTACTVVIPSTGAPVTSTPTEAPISEISPTSAGSSLAIILASVFGGILFFVVAVGTIYCMRYRQIDPILAPVSAVLVEGDRSYNEPRETDTMVALALEVLPVARGQRVEPNDRVDSAEEGTASYPQFKDQVRATNRSADLESKSKGNRLSI